MKKVCMLHRFGFPVCGHNMTNIAINIMFLFTFYRQIVQYNADIIVLSVKDKECNFVMTFKIIRNQNMLLLGRLKSFKFLLCSVPKYTLLPVRMPAHSCAFDDGLQRI